MIVFSIRSEFVLPFALLFYKILQRFYNNLQILDFNFNLTYLPFIRMNEVVLGLTHLFSLKTRDLGDRELFSDSILDDVLSCPFWT